MTVTLSNAGGSKTRNTVTLTSGTTWTVPAGVTLVNVKRKGGDGGSGNSGVGGGGVGGNTTFTGLASAAGGAGGGASMNAPSVGQGQTALTLEDSLVTTPSASITYAIGAIGTNPGFGAGNAGFVTIEWYI